MGHATAEETFQSIQALHWKLDLTHNLMEVSMDGPNQNWKIEIIQEHWEHNDHDDPDLTDIGSCRLHVLHGAYGTAQKAIDWNLNKLLKVVYSIFAFSPTWRKDYLEINKLLEP